MKKELFKVNAIVITTSLLTFVSSSFAHFGVILPSDDIVSPKDNKHIQLHIKFMHPFDQDYMNMEMPKAFGVLVNEKKQDLLKTLKKKTIKECSTWEAPYVIKEPGDHIFYVEPTPYWEPAEDSFIAHYTKVIVNALGKEDGWDAEVGLKTEIIPLTRPYGIWAGNIFQGIVKVDGKPVPYAEVEVEYYNENKKITVPDDAYKTQIIKADGNGVFTYAIPKAGWWGFAALTTADFKMKHEGKEYPVQLGAVLWIKASEMK
ncbi:MAG: DUF4198 domain-containing protein [Deltaproteobacteria bacterium]